MRVTAGDAKGLRLKVPASARPATSRVREALFSLLDVEGARLADLYAGSGALGIEALSRGAAWVDFVERSYHGCATIKQNLAATGLDGKGKAYCAPVSRALQFLAGEYDLILMDPPYSHASVNSLVTEVALSPRLRCGGLMVVMHSSRLSLLPNYGDLALIKQRCYGDNCVSIYRKGGSL